ncbi:hypothetical protein D3C71_1347470 [compost metagenome]
MLSWLKSPEAQSLTNIKAQELLGRLSNSLDIVPQELSYDKWLRLEAIKRDLQSDTFTNKLIHIVKVVIIIFGFVIIFYGMFLVIAYWIDRFNVLGDFSLLQFMTFGRFYAIASKEDLKYIRDMGTKVFYITLTRMIVIFMACLSTGLIFIFVSPVLNLLFKFYFKLTS